MAALDAFEEVGAGLYAKALQSVILEAGGTRRALIYWRLDADGPAAAGLSRRRARRRAGGRPARGLAARAGDARAGGARVRAAPPAAPAGPAPKARLRYASPLDPDGTGRDDKCPHRRDRARAGRRLSRLRRGAGARPRLVGLGPQSAGRGVWRRCCRDQPRRSTTCSRRCGAGRRRRGSNGWTWRPPRRRRRPVSRSGQRVERERPEDRREGRGERGVEIGHGRGQAEIGEAGHAERACAIPQGTMPEKCASDPARH